MSPWFEAFLAKYGAILFGLIVGTAARYGLILSEGRKITLRMLAADALLMGFLALAATEVVERLHLSGSAAGLSSAILALASDRVIRLMRDRFLRKVDAEIKAQAAETIGTVRQVVQTETSGQHIIEDTLTGKAPADYAALQPRVQEDEI